MVAADDDGRSDLAAADEVVDRLAELRTLAVAQPAHASGEPLERNPLLGEADPTYERLVVREELPHEPVRAPDVCRLARQRDPAERPAPFGEERADVLGNESRIAEGIGEAGLLRLAAQVVAVVDGDRAVTLELDDRLAVSRDRSPRATDVFLRIAPTQLRRVGDARRDVAIERIVRARLIGHDVDAHFAAHELG